MRQSMSVLCSADLSLKSIHPNTAVSSALVGDGVNYSSLTRLFSESVFTNKQFVLNMALSKQVSEFSTPSNQFEVESGTLTIRTKTTCICRPCKTMSHPTDSYQRLQKGPLSVDSVIA